MHLPPHMQTLVFAALLGVAGVFVGKWLERQKCKPASPHSFAAAEIKYCPNCGTKIEQVGKG